MDKQKLSSIIEGILFVAGNGIELQDIAEKLGVKIEDVRDAIQLLKEKYTDDNGINVMTYKGKVQLTSNPKYAEEIATVLNPIKEKALTKAALETVAIIAYQQPVTRLDIEQVRGVSSDYAIQLLLAHNLIEVVGRKDAVGKPLLFGTTDEFLKRFEIESLDDLPKYEDLLEQIQVIKSEDNSLYHEFDIQPFDTDEQLKEEDEKFKRVDKDDSDKDEDDEDDKLKNNSGGDYNDEDKEELKDNSTDHNAYKENELKNNSNDNNEEELKDDNADDDKDKDDEDKNDKDDDKGDDLCDEEAKCEKCGILGKADKEKQEDLNTRVEDFSSENQAGEKDINK